MSSAMSDEVSCLMLSAHPSNHFVVHFNGRDDNRQVCGKSLEFETSSDFLASLVFILPLTFNIPHLVVDHRGKSEQGCER